MLLPAERILGAIAHELYRLNGQESGGQEGSLRQSLDIGLRLLRKREREGRDAILSQLRNLSAALMSLAPALSPLKSTGPVFAQLQAAVEQGSRIEDLQSLEHAWRQIVADTEKLTDLLGRETQLEPALRLRLAQALTAWEIADLQTQLEQAATGQGDAGQLDATQLQHYLQQRFDDASLKVIRLLPLSGGFGKQTYLFDVQGKTISGSFVMRRDTEQPLLSNDCHQIHHEAQVIGAVRAQGFPAPDTAWLDTEHALLLGGHFLVMRRSPGEPGGSVFAAQSEIPQNLTATLAGILARLHGLAPMDALHATNESICAERRSMPLGDCVHRYLSDWFDTFNNEPHLPSPAIVSQFNWLLANVPEADGEPVLLHGDIGFHNFLFDDGKLSAVLDWEFAHLGDPAEDLAYVRNTLGGALDWPAFIAAYEAAGGRHVDERRLHFFQVWGHLRNAICANIAAAKFANGQAADLKLVVLPHLYIPQFLGAAQALIDQYEGAAQ